MSLMRKQKLHTSFSEVRADLAQLPSLSISPHSHHLHHLQKLSSSHHLPQNMARSLLGAVLRDPHRHRLPPFGFPLLSSGMASEVLCAREGRQHSCLHRGCPEWSALQLPNFWECLGSNARTHSLQHTCKGRAGPQSLVGKLRHGQVVGLHGRTAELPRGRRRPDLELPREPRPL